MLKKTISIIIIIFLFGFNKSDGHDFKAKVSEPIVSDTTAKRLGIKTAIQKTYTLDSNTLITTCVESFDLLGKVTNRIYINNYTNIIFKKELFFYNKKGKLMEVEIIQYSKKDSSISNQTYSYNSNGLQSKTFYGKNLNYKYNAGRIIEIIEQRNPKDFKTAIAYDSLGFLKSKKYYDDNSVFSKGNYEYNNKGQLTLIKTLYYHFATHELTIQENLSFVYYENGLLKKEQKEQEVLPAACSKADNKVYTYEYKFY